LGGSREVGAQRSALLRQPAADRIEHVVVAVVVDVHLVEPRPVRNLVQPTPDDALDIGEDLVLRGEKRVDAVLVDQLVDAPVRDLEGGHPGAHLEVALLGRPVVPDQRVCDVLSQAEPLDQLHGREERRLAEAVGRADDEAAGDRAADVRVVHDDRRPGDDLPFPEDRRREDPVVRVDRAGGRVVREEHVALLDLVAHPLAQDALDEDLEIGGVREDVDAGEELLARRRQQARVHVERLVDDRRAGQAGGEHSLLVVDRPQPVAEDLERNRIDRRRHAGCDTSATRTASRSAAATSVNDMYRSTSARYPGGTTTLSPIRSTTAGAITTSPGRSSSPRKIGTSTNPCDSKCAVRVPTSVGGAPPPAGSSAKTFDWSLRVPVTRSITSSRRPSRTTAPAPYREAYRRSNESRRSAIASPLSRLGSIVTSTVCACR